MSHQKILTNALAQFGGKFGTVLISFLVVKIITSFGADFYGSYVTVYEFLAFFGVLADAGLFAIAVRELSCAKKQKTQIHILGNILLMRLGLVIGGTILAGLVVQLIPQYNTWIKWGVWLTGTSMSLTIIAGTLSSVLQARMRIQYFSLSLVLGKVLLAVLIALIAWWGQEIWSLGTLFFAFLGAGILANFLFVSLVYCFVARELPIVLKFDRSYWKKTLKNSLPYGIALVFQTLYLRIDLLLISWLLGISAVGIYGVGARILESFLVLGIFFGQAILPRLTQLQAHQTQSNQILGWAAQKLVLVALPIMWGTYLFAPEMVYLLSNSSYLGSTDFLGADDLLKILVLTVGFAFFNQLFSFALIAKQKQKLLLLVNALGLGANLALNLYLLPKIGLLGAAWSTVVCELLVFLTLLIIFRQYYNPIGSKLNWCLILGVNFGLVVSIIFTPLAVNFWLSGLISALVYVSFFWVCRRRFFQDSTTQ